MVFWLILFESGRLFESRRIGNTSDKTFLLFGLPGIEFCSVRLANAPFAQRDLVSNQRLAIHLDLKLLPLVVAFLLILTLLIIERHRSCLSAAAGLYVRAAGP